MSTKIFTLREFGVIIISKGVLYLKNRLKEARLEKGLTLKQASKHIGIRDSTLSQYETGKREPKLETWISLSDLFGVPVSYLQGFGVSREAVINDLVDKIITEHDYFHSPFHNLDFDLQKKLTRKDIEFLNGTFNLYLEPSNYVIDDLIANNERKALGYLVSKYIPLVNDYNFLSSVPDNVNEYFSALGNKFANDKPDPFDFEKELDSANQGVFNAVYNSMILDSDTQKRLSDLPNSKKRDVSQQVQDLFKLLTDDTSDKRILDIKRDVTDLLDVYGRGEYKLATDTSNDDPGTNNDHP